MFHVPVPLQDVLPTPIALSCSTAICILFLLGPLPLLYKLHPNPHPYHLALTPIPTPPYPYLQTTPIPLPPLHPLTLTLTPLHPITVPFLQIYLHFPHVSIYLPLSHPRTFPLSTPYVFLLSPPYISCLPFSTLPFSPPLYYSIFSTLMCFSPYSASPCCSALFSPQHYTHLQTHRSSPTTFRL